MVKKVMNKRGLTFQTIVQMGLIVIALFLIAMFVITLFTGKAPAIIGAPFRFIKSLILGG